MFLLRLLFALCLLTGSGAAWANCAGTDLRASLSPEQETEIARRVTATPFAQGNHWVARKGDRQLHLIGTMHLSDDRMDGLMTRFAPTIEAAELLLVEATLEDKTRLQEMMSRSRDLVVLEGPSLIDRLPPETWALLAEALRARGMPPFMAAKMQPWVITLTLAVPPCALQAMQQGAKGLDERIMLHAASTGVPTAALENVEDVVAMMRGDDLDESLKMLALSILPVDQVEDLTATLVQQYFEEEPAAALETNRALSAGMSLMPMAEFDAQFDAFLDVFVRQRNEAWMEVIKAAPEKRIVIASGAFHMPGEFGLLNLLRQQGYKLERQPF